MNSAITTDREWLKNMPARLRLSKELRATGQFIRSEVQTRHFPSGFTRLLIRLLHSPGKLLGRPVMQGGLVEGRDFRLWALLTLLTAISASGVQPSRLSHLPSFFWRRARSASAAAEMVGMGLDIIDDIQDDDNPFIQEIGIPLALNAGLAFLELAPLTLDRARAAGWPDTLADAALKTLHTSLLTSLGGQFLDLHFEKRRAVSENQVLEMTGQKSGTLLALICRLGAMAGVLADQQRPPDYFEAISQFGWYLGIWSQLLNDLHDAELPQEQHGKSDRRREKKTLPLVLEQHGMIGSVASSDEMLSPDIQAALSYTFVAAETFRFRAQKALQTIEEHFGPHPLLWSLLQVSWEEEQPAAQ